MKTSIVILLIVLIQISVISQENNSANKDICCPEKYTGSEIKNPLITLEKIVIEDSTIYSSLPILKEKYTELLNKLTYSTIALRAGVEGKLIIQAIINTSGETDSCWIIKSLETETDEKALIVLKELKFIPATIKGQNAKSEIIFFLVYNYSVSFDKPSKTVSEIKLEYKPGMIYHYWKLIFKKDFTAYFEEKWSDKVEIFEGKIDESTYNRLNDFIHTICFFDLRESYGEDMVDSGELKISAKIDDKVKAIIINGEEPVGIWALTVLLNHIKQKIKWQQTN